MDHIQKWSKIKTGQCSKKNTKTTQRFESLISICNKEKWIKNKIVIQNHMKRDYFDDDDKNLRQNINKYQVPREYKIYIWKNIHFLNGNWHKRCEIFTKKTKIFNFYQHYCTFKLPPRMNLKISGKFHLTHDVMWTCHRFGGLMLMLMFHCCCFSCRACSSSCVIMWKKWEFPIFFPTLNFIN